MTVSLEKNETLSAVAVSLSKEQPELKKVTVGLGWTSNPGLKVDLDVSAFELTKDGVVPAENGDRHFIYFKNKTSFDGTIRHLGDNRDGGDGEKDDEQINMDLTAVPPEIERIPVAVAFFNPKGRSFKDVAKAYIRVVDQDTGDELSRFNLPADFGNETALVAGELFRNNGIWDFRAVGQPYASGIAGIVTDFGLEVG